jgi:hypothetical protein
VKENNEEDNNGYIVFNEISTDHLGNRVVMRGEALLYPPSPFQQQAFFRTIN